jgi:hypothetical protein
MTILSFALYLGFKNYKQWKTNILPIKRSNPLLIIFIFILNYPSPTSFQPLDSHLFLQDGVVSTRSHFHIYEIMAVAFAC